MNKTVKKIINPTTFLIIIFAICFFVLNKGLITLDDKIYQEAFNSIPTCIKWISEFYVQWSGRITLTALINVFVNLPTIMFKISNVIMFIITLLSIYKITTLLFDKWKKEYNNILLTIIFAITFFISIPVINSGALWVAGAMNYFWPVAMMLVAIIPFISELKNKQIGKQYYIFAIIANIFAAFAEQTAAILVAFGFITILWCKVEKRKISKLLIAHYIIIVILSLINLLAPGNSARSYAEELKWYPSFSTLTLSDKLIQGYIQTAKHIINDSTILISIIALISSYFIIIDKKTKKINKVIALIPIAYVVIKIFPFNQILGRISGADIDGLINNIFFNFEKFSINTIYSSDVLKQLISSSVVLGIIAGQLIYVFKTKKTGIIVAILYLASICSALVMSFSPTLYVSGNRVFMTTDLILVLISSILSIKLFKTLDKKNSKLKYVLLIGLIILSFVFYINLYENGTNVIIY